MPQQIHVHGTHALHAASSYTKHRHPFSITLTTSPYPQQMHGHAPVTQLPHSHTRNVQIYNVHQELPNRPKLPAESTLAPTLSTFSHAGDKVRRGPRDPDVLLGRSLSC